VRGDERVADQLHGRLLAPIDRLADERGDLGRAIAPGLLRSAGGLAKVGADLPLAVTTDDGVALVDGGCAGAVGEEDGIKTRRGRS